MKKGNIKWSVSIKSVAYITLYVAVLLMLLMMITTSNSNVKEPAIDDKYQTNFK